MDLYLTNHARVRNTNFCTTDGQVMYKSETPGSLFAPNKRTTIYKIIPNHASEDMADRFTDLATIAWHARPRLSKLTYDGVKMSIVTKGVLARQYVFAAPGDGRLFKWTLRLWTETLELNDGSNIVVARSHRSDIGIVTGRPRQARLEISPGFEHLADIILVTYILVETIRKDR